MKRHLIALLVLFLVTTSTMFGQILNAGFEDWSNGPTGSPDYWLSTGSVVQWVASHSGSSAVKGTVVQNGMFETLPALQAGDGGTGFSINSQPTALHGYFVFKPASQSFYRDTLTIDVKVWQNDPVNGDTVIGAGSFSQDSTLDEYREFVANIAYTSSGTPDKITIAVGIGRHNFATPGSYFLLDDLFLEPTVGVQNRKDDIPGTYTLSQNYPNPFNPTTTINFALPHAEFTTLAIFDVLGKEVARLVNGELTAGQHSVSWTAPQAGISSGTYYYQLRSGKHLQSKKLILAK